MNNQPQLYRKRYYPEEMILLKDDKILKHDKNLIVTSWDTLKPRKDFSHGYSAYFLNEGFKVSKMLDSNNNLVYWYCDIIRTHYNKTENSYIFEDLLADVLVYEDGFVKVVDLNEISDLIDEKKISEETVSLALRILNDLLTIIYAKEFYKYQDVVNEFCCKADK